MPPVNSSMFKALDHDPATGVLTVTFANGSVHKYEGVSGEENAALMASPSKGKYFNTNIKGKASTKG